MKKILVPIDFSPASRSGFEYAAQLSILTGAELFVINVYPEPEKKLPHEVLLLKQLKMEKDRKNQLEQFARIYPHEMGNDLELNLNVNYLVRCGGVEEQIAMAALELAADLTIIGTKAKHSLWEYIFGSVSYNLIQKSKIPVLIIPQGTIFQKPKKIAYGTELYLNEKTAHEYLSTFAKALKASIEQVHINLFPSDFYDLKEEVIHTNLSEDAELKKVTVVRDTSVKRGIDFFIKTHQIDILALYLPKRSFTENLLHRSLSKSYALSGKVPLLIFKDD